MSAHENTHKRQPFGAAFSVFLRGKPVQNLENFFEKISSKSGEKCKKAHN